MALFTLHTQAVLSRVRAELDLFNQQVSYVQHCHDRTFAGLAGANFAVNQSNLANATFRLAVRAEVLIGVVNQLIDESAQLLRRE